MSLLFIYKWRLWTLKLQTCNTFTLYNIHIYYNYILHICICTLYNHTSIQYKHDCITCTLYSFLHSAISAYTVDITVYSFIRNINQIQLKLEGLSELYSFYILFYYECIEIYNMNSGGQEGKKMRRSDDYLAI